MFEKSRHCVVLSVFTGSMGTVPLPTRGTDAIPPKGVGFLQARLSMEPLSKAFLLLCERDARAPSTHNAGNVGVPPEIPTMREKTYPFKLLKVPPASRGNPLPARFPSQSGGTHAPHAVPLAKRGEPEGGGQL